MRAVIRYLNANKLIFRTEEQIIFYELDRSNIFNEETNYGQKSLLVFKFFTNAFYMFMRYYSWFHPIKTDSSFLKPNFTLIRFYYNYIYKKVTLLDEVKIQPVNLDYHIITIYLLKKKLLITGVFKQYMYLNLTPGILTKKLNIKEKKYKKSSKILNLMFKITFLKIKKYFNIDKLILRFKGITTKYQFHKLNNLLNINMNMPKNVYTMVFYVPNISYNTKFRKKKIKAIKKNIRKKIALRM